MQRPSFENMLNSLSSIKEDKKYNVLEFQADTENKQILVKTNPEFINIIKRYTLNALIKEIDEKLQELDYQGKEKQESIMKVFLEKEEGEYRISVEANEVFENQLEFFKSIEDIMKEMIFLLEEKVREYETSEGKVLETKSYKMVFDKDYNILNTQEIEKEFERLKDKYSFMKNMSVLKEIFKKENCDYIEYVYQTDDHMEWNEMFYTYNKN